VCFTGYGVGQVNAVIQYYVICIGREGMELGVIRRYGVTLMEMEGLGRNSRMMMLEVEE
jgi:hypothetical protein